MSDRRVSFSSPSVGSSSGGATSSTSSSTTAHPHRPASTRSNGPVTPADVHTAFTFFDVAKRGAINVEELKARVTMFYPALTAVELQAMMMGKDELTEADLYELLASHTLTNYDPVAEAFKLYDPQGTGAVDLEVLRGYLLQCGLSDLTKGDMGTLLDLSDRDRDGRIGLSDFRRMLTQPR